MPALSFQGEWLDKLLSGEKQQTTRQQSDRFKVGDVVHIYNKQRQRIMDKPLRRMTPAGIDMMYGRGYPFINEFHHAMYHAHFLGKVKITEVYDILPANLSGRSAWAKADGFDNFTCADTWFRSHYGDDWLMKTWTVIKWDGWLERYFEQDIGQS